jgi:hypothetical protein
MGRFDPFSQRASPDLKLLTGPDVKVRKQDVGSMIAVLKNSSTSSYISVP